MTNHFIVMLTLICHFQLIVSLLNSDGNTRKINSNNNRISMLNDGNGKSRKKIVSPKDIESVFSAKNNDKSPKVQYEFLEIDNNLYNDEEDDNEEYENVMKSSTDDDNTNFIKKSSVSVNNVNSVNEEQYKSTPDSTNRNNNAFNNENQSNSKKEEDICYDDDYLNLANSVDKVRLIFNIQQLLDIHI